MKSTFKLNEIFFLAILIAALYFCYLIFEPFIQMIFVAGALAVTIYNPYKSLVKSLKGNKTLASGLMTLGVLMLIIIPLGTFMFFLSKNTLEVYSALTINLNNDLPQTLQNWLSSHISGLDMDVINEQLGSFASSFNSWLVTSLSNLLKSSTQVIMSLFIMLMTVFFLLRDGKQLLERIIRLTPLPDKYDRLIFTKFKEVSYSAIASSIITGFVQGIVAGIGYFIVGVPSILLVFATILGSFIPFAGAALIWWPVVFYLLINQLWWQAIFLTLWGIFVVGVIDNILRPMLMKGKTQVHPLILFFSIFGGIVFFGFWGIIFGPLIISIAFTLLHIYEVEYCGLLDGCEEEKPKKRTTRKKTKTTKK